MDNTFKILIPFDFSNAAENAMNYAGSFIANDENAEVVLVYVKQTFEEDGKEEALYRAINNFKKEYAHPVKAVVKYGELMSGLLDVAGEEKASMIFMGTGLLKDEKVCTNTSSLALAAQCPVLVIPVDYKDFRINKIALVIGKDLIHNNKLLETLLEVARRFNAEVEVLTVKNDETRYGYSREDQSNENTLSYYLENFYSQHVFVEGPDIVQEIFNYVEKKDIDLVTILPRNHAEEPLTSQGRLTKFLCEKAEAPLLVVDL